MIKYLSALALVFALGACSSDSNSGDDDAGDTGTTSGTTSGDTTSGNTDATSGDAGATAGNTNSGGATPGVWFGSNSFGEGVMVIDANENIYALASNAGRHEVVFGPASEQLERFLHRDSENASFAQSFTLAGDLPSTQGEADTIAYSLTVENDGQQIRNTGGAGDFVMTFATENDLPALSLADAAGSWSATTSFCPVDCNITLQMNITADGVVSGSTEFNNFGPAPLNGNAASPAGVTQYLTVSFEWLEKRRTGVLHRDRLDSSRLVLNTVGPNDEGGSQSFTASMIRQ